MTKTTSAGREIFRLRQKATRFLLAGDTEEYNRILLKISELQQTNGVFSGAKEENFNDRNI